MFYIELKRNGAVENVFEVTTEKHIQELPQKVFEANQKAGFLKYITEKNALEHLTEILAFAKEQKDRADTAEIKLQAAEYFEDFEGED